MTPAERAPDGGADLEAIRERAAFDVLPQEERFAVLRAEIAAMSDDEWFSEADKPIQRRAVACREDRRALLAHVDAQRVELGRLRAAFAAVLADVGYELVGDEIRRLSEETSHAT